MDPYKITFETWNKLALLYEEKFMDLDLYDESYDAFCQQISTAHPSILELGCGPGNITRNLLSKRPDFQIEGIDIAPNMISLAQKNNPTAQFRVMDCREIDKLTKKFDGIICGFCIPYLSQSDCAKLIRDAYHLLHDGGLLYFSFIEGAYSKSGFEAGSTGDKSFVYYHQEAFFRKELEENDFQLMELMKVGYPKGSEMSQTHLIFMAKKNAPFTTL